MPGGDRPGPLLEDEEEGVGEPGEAEASWGDPPFCFLAGGSEVSVSVAVVRGGGG